MAHHWAERRERLVFWPRVRCEGVHDDVTGRDVEIMIRMDGGRRKKIQLKILR